MSNLGYFARCEMHQLHYSAWVGVVQVMSTFLYVLCRMKTSVRLPIGRKVVRIFPVLAVLVRGLRRCLHVDGCRCAAMGSQSRGHSVLVHGLWW